MKQTNPIQTTGVPGESSLSASQTTTGAGGSSKQTYLMKTTNKAGNPVMNLQRDIDPFTQAYIECALWASIGDDGDPLDETHNWTHIADEALAKMMADCEKFQVDNTKLLCVSQSANAREGGHCLWLSRNGHGSGFFDSDHFANDVRDMLQAAAKSFGTCDLFIGDDGNLYVS